MRPGRVGVIAVSSWTADAGPPVASLIPERARSGASLLTRMAAHVLGDVLDQTRVDASNLAVVHATRHGEIGATLELSAGHEEQGGASSPERLAACLYDTAAAGISFATRNTGFTTTVAAGSRTVAMGLLEAISVLDQLAEQVALVVLEEAMPGPLTSGAGYDGLAVAMLLRRTDAAPWTLDGLGPRMIASGVRRGVPAAVAANPCSSALALVAAMHEGRYGPVVLESTNDGPGRTRWCVDVGAGSRSS
jgi:hypothetical protein